MILLLLIVFSGYNSHLLRRLRHLRNLSLRTIKDDSHLLKRVASSLWIVEVRRCTKANQNRYKYNIIFPPNGFKSDRINERVEEDGDDG